jgi:integrase
MGVKIRFAYGGWYIFVNHQGERAAVKCVDEQHAIHTQKAVQSAIAAGQLDITRLQRKRKEPKEEKPSVPTLERYYEDIFRPVYLDSAVAQSTAAAYKNNFKMHMIPGLGQLRLDEIGHDRIEEFVSDLVKKGLAKATIQTIIKDLTTLFNHARKRKVISENPATDLTQLYSQAKAKHEKIEPLTKKEVPLFLKAVQNRKESAKHYAMYFMAIHTGMRPEELAGVQRGDLDFNGQYVIVQRAIDRVHRKIVPTKTSRIRRIELSDELISVLKGHLRQQREYWLAQGKAQPDWLFPNEEGSWSDMSNIANRHFYPCMEKAGLHRRRPYDLRHTYASLLLTAGAPMAFVSEQMGHANIQLTVKLYGHLEPRANRHWLNRLPGLKKARKTRPAAASSCKSSPEMKKAANDGGEVVDFKSGTRDSNPRLQPWQGCTLPLS